ncbi:MAG: hypothetical protein V1914_02320 [archaeon]
MICLLALPILAILGIFSATHRKIAAEAFDCVFRRITLRKCESSLDTRLKSSITATVMRRSPKTAGWIFKHFELISWIFLILMLISTFYSIQGVYNYVAYGNCNGEDSPAYCIFTEFETTTTTCELCNHEPCTCEEQCVGEECPETCDTGGE